MLSSPFHTEFKQLAEITEFIGGDIHIRTSDVPIPSPALFPKNLAEPQDTKQPCPRKTWSETWDDAKSEGNVAEKGAL